VTSGLSSDEVGDAPRLGESEPIRLDVLNAVTGRPAALCGAADGVDELERPLEERRWAFCRLVADEPWLCAEGAGAGVDAGGEGAGGGVVGADTEETVAGGPGWFPPCEFALPFACALPLPWSLPFPCRLPCPWP
jgi:hypothetical protein